MAQESKAIFRRVMEWLQAGPDLPKGYVGLSLGPQDPKGSPANCGTHLK